MGDELQTYNSPTQDHLFPLCYLVVNLAQVFLKLYPLVQDSFYFNTGGVFWRLAWQHPWESELSATRSSFESSFVKVLGVLGLRLISLISRFIIMEHHLS